MGLLAKHQREAFYYGKTVEHPAYFMEMRLGKTRVTIRDLIVSGNVPALIVAPYSALYGWEKELLICGVPKEDICILNGTKSKRTKSLFQRTASFYLTNHESHLSIGAELINFDFQALVIDESTCLKFPPKRRFNQKKNISTYYPRISYFFCRYFRNVKRRYILTGTPMPNSPLDIYQQLKFLDSGIFLQNNYWEFRNQNFKNVNKFHWFMTKKGKNYITNKLNQYCFFMTSKEAGLFTPKVYERKVFKLPPKSIKAYKTLAKEFILEYDDKILNVTDFSLVKFMMLRMLCSGVACVQIKENGDKIYKAIDDSKLKILQELITTDLKNSKIIIWANYYSEMNMISEMLRKKKITYFSIDGRTNLHHREYFVEYFQTRRNLQVILANPSCFKYGANLNKADVSIFYSSPLGLETRVQSEARMVNPFSKETDLIIDLVAENTIEGRIIDSLRMKETKQEMLFNIIKHLQRVR